MTTAIVRSMARALIIAAPAIAGTFTGFTFSIASAHASATGAYAAVLAAPVASPRREIVDGAIWRCERDRCSAPADGARPQTVCAKVARKFGPVISFATPQITLSAEQVARCNGAE